MVCACRTTTEIESQYYLGTHENIRWSKVELQFNQKASVEIAHIDLFNNGSAMNLIRFLGTVSSHQRQDLFRGSFENGKWSAAEIRFSPYRERNQRISTNLSTGFDFSFVDLIRSRGINYVLLKPSRETVRDARVYVLRVYGVIPNRGAADYDLMCTMTTP
jgi:hypothetical protein